MENIVLTLNVTYRQAVIIREFLEEELLKWEAGDIYIPRVVAEEVYGALCAKVAQHAPENYS